MPFDQFFTDFRNTSNEEWIPLMAIGIIVLAWIGTGFSYYYIEQGMRLLFYAVLVQIVTKVYSELPRSRSRNFAFLAFVFVSISAVTAGMVVESFAEMITGDLLAIQSLALAVFVSRLYINIQDVNLQKLSDILRYKQPIDRYLIIVPCGMAFFIPTLLYQLHIRIFQLETAAGFLLSVGFCLILGLGLYEYER